MQLFMNLSEHCFLVCVPAVLLGGLAGKMHGYFSVIFPGVSGCSGMACEQRSGSIKCMRIGVEREGAYFMA